ncbi:Protein kinase domain-containing protein [Andreprevotia lacus DSM 23236]|jgi:serine/threonine protein kinase|uniref:Protein kinase domain-containing protein n=1 Tax=Andreprevotia lacus DSM 23236 TaxID=1121001 RepID=A0A1W1XWQ0_9NEIS|nr:kinase [Andreprevotia lacus]SMC28356.1 Protein kinase domain-containing protein [Andreprevotia lacus DSM 23236]
MAKVVKCKTLDGQDIEFVDDIIGSGAMKDVYFSPDKSYVVGFYKTGQDAQAKERLQMITGKYRENIFNQVGGDYWKHLFCWPTAMLEHNGKLGMVAPAYARHFFFEHGSKNNDMLQIKGKEKEGKWFAAPNLRNRFVDTRELGDWLNHIKVCLLLARAVRRMHFAGLAHSDLSYKNVLVDPSRGMACVIDVDGLVVPGKFPPDVVGTPDFIAPEVIQTGHLAKDDPARCLPKRETDQHALAVLIYMYLLYRHPLRGGKVHDLNDEQRDETLTMGERALFVEHPVDKSNRIKIKNVKPSELPWADTDKIPFTVTGPYLKALFLQAFVNGLHDPAVRPSANDWETALVKTVDLVQPCQSPACEQKWYVFDNSTQPQCPFCGTPFKGKLPVLNLYSSRKEGSYRPDNHRLMVYTNQSMFPWHANNLIVPNEKLADEQKKRIGYFVLHNDRWWLVNERMPDLTDVTDEAKRPVAIGEKLELKDGQKILFGKGDGGRLAVVQMVEA